MLEDIVADTSFYICYECDIKKRKWLDHFINYYSFNMGKRIFEELPDSLLTPDFVYSNIKIYDEDFFEIIRPFFNENGNP